MREQLLGYLLGALDADERAEIERRLNNSPELRAELDALREHLMPLEVGRVEYEPPGDLVERTCAFVDANRDQPVRHVPSPAPPAAKHFEPLAHRSGTRMFEMLITAGVCAAMAILFFPAVLESRDQARRTFCQSSMRRLGEALTRYSADHRTIPSIPAEGPLSFAGMVPVQLYEKDLLVDSSVLLCPSSDLAAEDMPFSIPELNELQSATDQRLWELKRRAGGSYGYNLGVYVDGKYLAPVNESRANFVWAGDAPSLHLPHRMSANHGGRGMNLLFEDGHVKFVTGYRVPGTRDDVLRSLHGLAEAGRHKNDSVIGLSVTGPRITPTLWGR